jgi:hypothetical protein
MCKMAKNRDDLKNKKRWYSCPNIVLDMNILKICYGGSKIWL